MKRILTEELVLLTSVVKWTVLSAFIGAVIGVSTAIFLRALDSGILLASRFENYFFFLPLSLLLSAWLVRRFAPGAEGHGTEKIIEAVHRHDGRIAPAVVPVKLAATVVTIAGGGSAGKEGPAAQIGAALASFFAGLFRFDDTDRKKFVICGISAGFASVFGTPVAGAIFGIEVLFVGGMLYNVLLPSLVAGITSYHTASWLGVEYMYHPVACAAVPGALFSGGLFPLVVLGGLFFGLCSLLFIETTHCAKGFADNLRLKWFFKPLAGGVALVALALVFPGRYLGLGTGTIREALSGGVIPGHAFLLKIIFTSLTLGFGGSGGVVTPIFFIGAASGSLFASLAGADPAFFSAVGLVALLAGAANTPLAAAVMSVELFGADILVYACVACVISFFITGHRSIFPSQVLNIRKSTSFDVHVSRDMHHVKVSLKKRKKSVIGFVDGLIETLKGRPPGSGRPPGRDGETGE